MRRRIPTQAQIEVMKRRDNIRRDILNGIESRTALAVRYGKSLPVISEDVKAIMLDIRKQYEENGLVEAEVIQERVNSVYSKAADGFERSRQDEEKIKISYERNKCPDCSGTGLEEGSDEWCFSCDGEGVIVDEVITREIRGQAGDSAFLRVQLDCLKELARLKGLVAVSRDERNAVQININTMGVDLSNVSNANLLEALKFLQPPSRNGDQQTLDVESSSVSDNE